MHDKVFPEHAVKQALAELDIDRSDDGILTVMQCDLTTLCLTTVLRGAMVSCLLRKRKFLNDADISYALCSCTLPVSSRSSRDIGFLLDSRYFGALCAQHCKLLAKVLEPEFAMMKQVAEVKISAETQVLVQRAVERVVRGVLGGAVPVALLVGSAVLVGGF